MQREAAFPRERRVLSTKSTVWQSKRLSVNESCREMLKSCGEKLESSHSAVKRSHRDSPLSSPVRGRRRKLRDVNGIEVFPSNKEVQPKESKTGMAFFIPIRE